MSDHDHDFIGDQFNTFGYKFNFTSLITLAYKKLSYLAIDVI